MIPHRFARLLGAVLLLAPTLAFGQSSLQQPGTKDPLPVALPKLYGNDLFLQNLIASRFNTLGAAALLNVGTIKGTVADGGALAAETGRAQTAEQANAAAIQTNATAIANETSRAQGVEALKAPIASPNFTGTPNVPTAPAGTATTQAASTAFVASAVAAGGGGGSGGVPTSRQILTSGLATGGGDLSADRTITVPAAAQSDVATGTDQTKALTSYSVAAALGAKAPLASPAFVGTPTAPTAALGTNSTQIATTAFARLTSGASPAYGTAPNLSLAASVSGNALTLAIKTSAGADPSAADPVVIAFRDATLAAGDPVRLTLTAATALTIPSGSTLGAVSGKPFRIWLVALNDGGTVRLAAFNASDAFGVRSISPYALVTAAASGNSVGTYYAGVAVSTPAPLVILGYAEWASGLSTAGTWASAPTTLQLFGPGVPRPGQVVQTVQGTSTTSTQVTASAFTATSLSASVTPTSPCNPVRFQAAGGLTSEATGIEATASVFRGSTQVGSAASVFTNNGTSFTTSVAVMQGLDFPGVVSATTYGVQIKASSSGSAVDFPRTVGGGNASTILLDEIMG